MVFQVTSALDGFVCIEPVPWGDQFTLDYNLEATFWGAGSSNRLAFIHPVMASTTNPGAVVSKPQIITSLPCFKMVQTVAILRCALHPSTDGAG